MLRTYNILVRSVRQKGQAIVEFAIILPLFLMMFFTIAYAGTVFADYLILNNAARTVAHEAVTRDLVRGDDGKVQWWNPSPEAKRRVGDRTKQNMLSGGAVVWNPNDGEQYKVELSPIENTSPQQYDIKVVIKADLDTTKSFLSRLAYNLMKSHNSPVIKNFIEIEYYLFCPYRD